jgi:phthalate 4,5-cis-dihydrodiol dehydrogenase
VTSIGIVGLGTAGRAFIPAIRAHAGLKLAAVCDPIAEVRDAVAGELAVRAYADLRQLLLHPGLDAVYIATPTMLHHEHAGAAFAAGKHVLLEKPMTARLQDAKDLVAAAERAGRVLVLGHSHSFDLPIARMREVIVAGTLGRVRMVNTWCYSNWIFRPRRPDELDAAQGGGATLRQGSHQFDIIRLLCGGMARSVRARTFGWDPDRRGIGAHVVFIDFEDGAAATAVYNGYGFFSSAELCFSISEWGEMQSADARPLARRPALTPEAELRAKQERSRNAIPGSAPYQPFFGLTLVSCERGDLRQSPTGLTIYSHEGVTEIPLPTDRSPRDRVIAEFYDAVTGRAPALHDGRWGLANLEVCMAAMASSESGQEVLLKEQVPVP